MTVARSHKGSAKPTTLAGGISNTATSFTVATGGGTGFPDGSAGAFVVTLDALNASEEKILCSARAGDTFTVSGGGRGYDDTTAISHVNNASVRHTFSAIEAQELNDHIVTTTRDDHTQYGLVKKGLAALRGAIAHRSMQLHLSTDTSILGVDDGSSWVDFQSKAAADAAYAPSTVTTAWTAFTPSFGGVTLGNGAVVGAYKLNGKTLHFRALLTLGSTSSVTGAITLTLPASLTALGTQVVPVQMFTGGLSYLGAFGINSGSGVGNVISPTSGTSTVAVNADATHPSAWSATGNVVISGTLEVN